MKIFIQDIPVNIVSDQELMETGHFDRIIDCNEGEPDFSNLQDVVLIRNADKRKLDNFLVLLKQNKFKKLEEITFSVSDYDDVIKFFKSKYNIIKAAGGLVFKDGEVLMIYRLKKWDLPKGKLDSGEKSKDGAVREVEEECNIKVKLGKKICTTWHTYKRNGKRILKKTNWYVMFCIDDSEMKPQIEEDIEMLKWMNEREAYQASYNSYSSIRHVFRCYYNLGYSL